MAAGDIIMSAVTSGSPSFPCGPCGLHCHDLWGDTLPVILSGYADCSCYALVDGIPRLVTGHTGLDGAFTATWDGSVWTVVVGTITFQKYVSGTGGCDVPDGDPITEDCTLSISCTTTLGVSTLDIGIIASQINNDNLLFRAFASIDTTAPNIYSCGSSQGAIVEHVHVATP